ncbi:MAG: amidohydrolase family protein [Chloroflexota bacterium]
MTASNRPTDQPTNRPTNRPTDQPTNRPTDETMATIKLPGLIDAHVHLREPGYTHKEDFYTGTCAALAGGMTTVLDMPNTSPPTDTPERLTEKRALADSKAVCDVGLFVGATSDHPTDSPDDAYLPVATQACGLKIYVSETFGSLRIDELGLMHGFFRTWAEKAEQSGYRSADQPQGIGPIAVHAEDMMLPVCLNLSQLYAVPLHIVHVSRRSEIELIRKAKECGLPVTCEVTPHHLLLSADTLPQLGVRGDMRPRLATPDDVVALWENLDVVDIFATDHAPHTMEEKNKPEGTPGVPGVETMLPLLITLVQEGRLTQDDILHRCYTRPKEIYGIPNQLETEVEVDVDQSVELSDNQMITQSGWTPFAGMTVRGKVTRVILRGQVVYDGEKVVASPGYGTVLYAR